VLNHSYLLPICINYIIFRFSFNDGLLPEACPHVNETSWVLNFKRGILSALQNTMKRFDVDHQSIDVRYCNEFAGSILQWKFITLKVQYTTLDYSPQFF
jgi:hypothetical protein